MGKLDLASQLAFYRAYHFNSTNVAIHLVCIPIILLSTIAFLTPVNVLGDSYEHVNLGSIIAVGYGLFYVFLDSQLGIPTMSVLVAAAYGFKEYYLSLGQFSSVKPEQFVHIAIIAHISSWLAQFYGHAFHEKRAPALTDNLLQALVLAPFFVSFEIAFGLGLRADLKKQMDNKAGVIFRDMKHEEHLKQKKAL